MVRQSISLCFIHQVHAPKTFREGKSFFGHFRRSRPQNCTLISPRTRTRTRRPLDTRQRAGKRLRRMGEEGRKVGKVQGRERERLLSEIGQKTRSHGGNGGRRHCEKKSRPLRKTESDLYFCSIPTALSAFSNMSFPRTPASLFPLPLGDQIKTKTDIDAPEIMMLYHFDNGSMLGRPFCSVREGPAENLQWQRIPPFIPV